MAVIDAYRSVTFATPTPGSRVLPVDIVRVGNLYQRITASRVL